MDYIFDLDNTILDTRRVMAMLIDRISFVSNMKNEVERSFVELKKLKPFAYSLEEHLKLAGINQTILDDPELNFFDDLSSFLNQGSTETLQRLKESGHHLHLLTRGDFRFQSLKINNSGLKDFFQSIRIVAEAKEKALREICGQRKAVFINDNLQENTFLAPLFPMVDFILYVRNDADRFYDPKRVEMRKIYTFDELT